VPTPFLPAAQEPVQAKQAYTVSRPGNFWAAYKARHSAPTLNETDSVKIERGDQGNGLCLSSDVPLHAGSMSGSR